MTRTLTIQNEAYLLEVDTRGAEPRSLIWKEGGIELLWQGDPAFWPRRAPTLFPIVGKLNGGRYRWRGREFHLPQHGFARDQEFEVEGAGPQRVAFALRETPETLVAYPFPFEFTVEYGIGPAGLEVLYRVRNSGEEPMPFCLGAHPGFRCPLREGERFEDYELKFETPETLTRHLLQGGLLAPTPEPFLENEDTLPLSHDLFARDAIVLKGVRSRWVALGPRHGGPTLRVTFEGWPYLGLWTKPGARFLCIEPWQGLADPEGFAGEFAEKEGAVVLAPGEVFERGYAVEVVR